MKVPGLDEEVSIGKYLSDLPKSELASLLLLGLGLGLFFTGLLLCPAILLGTLFSGTWQHATHVLLWDRYSAAMVFGSGIAVVSAIITFTARMRLKKMSLWSLDPAPLFAFSGLLVAIASAQHVWQLPRAIPYAFSGIVIAGFLARVLWLCCRSQGSRLFIRLGFCVVLAWLLITEFQRFRSGQEFMNL